MCIRDRNSENGAGLALIPQKARNRVSGTPAMPGDGVPSNRCLLYTSDAADERSSVDLGGRRIIKNKHSETGDWIRVLQHP